MSTPLEGEVIHHRHNNKKRRFYPQAGQQRLVWSGCLAPLLVFGMFIYLIFQGATSEIGIELIRGFIIFIVVFLLLQLFIGGGIFKKGSGTFKAMILANASVILLIVMLLLVGLASVVQQLFT